MNILRASFLTTLAAAALPACAVPPATSGAPPDAQPDFATMTAVQPRSGKIGVPVDVRYQYAGTITAGQPVSLHIAVIPRVEGRNLKIELPRTAGLASGGKSPASAVFGKAAAADTLRYTVELTPLAGAPDHVPLIVSMDVGGGHFFSVFPIPLAAAPIQ